MDNRIRAIADSDREALRSKVNAHKPKILAFTSKRAGELFLGEPCAFGQQVTNIGATKIFVLPSPSPAARGSWKANSYVWQDLANAVIERA
jgi:TDG/mug DNA glycosylase family protein